MRRLVCGGLLVVSMFASVATSGGGSGTSAAENTAGTQSLSPGQTRCDEFTLGLFEDQLPMLTGSSLEVDISTSGQLGDGVSVSISGGGRSDSEYVSGNGSGRASIDNILGNCVQRQGYCQVEVDMCLEADDQNGGPLSVSTDFVFTATVDGATPIMILEHWY